jgi:hypothetical protein
MLQYIKSVEREKLKYSGRPRFTPREKPNNFNYTANKIIWGNFDESASIRLVWVGCRVKNKIEIQNYFTFFS